MAFLVRIDELDADAHLHSCLPHAPLQWGLDVLHFPSTSAHYGKLELVPYVIVDLFRQTDSSGVGQGLYAGGDVDRVAVDVILVMNDISEMNPDAESDLPPGRVHGVSFVKRSLHFKGTPDGLECAREFHEKPVAYRLDLFAGVSREEWPEEASMLFKQLECECLVSLRERRIACDVCEHYRGESTLGLWQFVISVISKNKILCLVGPNIRRRQHRT